MTTGIPFRISFKTSLSKWLQWAMGTGAERQTRRAKRGNEGEAGPMPRTL